MTKAIKIIIIFSLILALVLYLDFRGNICRDNQAMMEYARNLTGWDIFFHQIVVSTEDIIKVIISGFVLAIQFIVSKFTKKSISPKSEFVDSLLWTGLAYGIVESFGIFLMGYINIYTLIVRLFVINSVHVGLFTWVVNFGEKKMNWANIILGIFMGIGMHLLFDYTVQAGTSIRIIIAFFECIVFIVYFLRALIINAEKNNIQNVHNGLFIENTYL